MSKQAAVKLLCSRCGRLSRRLSHNWTSLCCSSFSHESGFILCSAYTCSTTAVNLTAPSNSHLEVSDVCLAPVFYWRTNAWMSCVYANAHIVTGSVYSTVVSCPSQAAQTWARLLPPTQHHWFELGQRNNHLDGLLCTQQDEMGSSFAVKIYICLFLGSWSSPVPTTHITVWMFFCLWAAASIPDTPLVLLPTNAPLLLDIELFIYFPAPPVNPYERLGASGLLRHDLEGY